MSNDLSALQSHEVISSRTAFTDTPHANACHARNKAFLCEYCPKQFVRISSRYKHAMLAHSRAARLTPKAGSTGETVLSWNDRSTNSLVTPTKRKATMSSPDCQPEGKKFRRNEINFELKTKLEQSEFLLDATSNESVSRAHYRDPSRQHGFSCGSRSRTSTQQGFVYSETKLANKPSQSLFDATGNESVSTSHHSDQARQHGFSSQSEILEQCSSIPDNFSEVLSVSGADSEPYERGTCYATLRTKGDWTKHVHETHNGDANEVVCSIDDRVGLSRPALRTISSSLQNSNKLKSLRNRHNSRTTEITYDKQVKVPSMRQCKFVKQTSSLKTALNKKRFECDICHSWFRERCTMFRHKLSRHNDERPFQCDSCGYAAKRKDGLDSHYARAHCS
ncbi:hypothetical protein OS493_003513 [Desmophyllum pertusum]|uniref:C2H2-type domain-containing protein n=1 Tax=Desmophyllum pertusum TaxID=174260 RepID=A0A9X0A5J3_9CNID|nr:hypothetical protein OS493_003513 [Desmophyllum pertusum]